MELVHQLVEKIKITEAEVLWDGSLSPSEVVKQEKVILFIFRLMNQSS